MNNPQPPDKSELGKKTEYESQYNPEKLFPISRKSKREEIGVYENLPFYGYDLWNHYEVSWLNEKGKPVIALAEIIYSCESENIIESKSMKLYFNTLNNSKFKDFTVAKETIKQDLEARLGLEVMVNLLPVASMAAPKLEGICIDNLDIECSVYHANPDFLSVENRQVDEILYSDLLKSNCLVTHQPDWCSVQIAYTGKKINREGLLRYIVSFRNDNEFHEQCIEKIFMQILEKCQPERLRVYGRSTRRGGLDINSCRSTHPISGPLMNEKLARQ